MDQQQTEWDLDSLTASQEDAGEAVDGDLPDDAVAIIGYLCRHCVGMDNARTSKVIAADLGIGSQDGRQVRNLISLYQERFPRVVCGQPVLGFWITEDTEEMAHYERALHATIEAVAVKISKLRRNARRCGFVHRSKGGGVSYTRVSARFQPVSGEFVSEKSVTSKDAATQGLTRGFEPDSSLAGNGSNLSENPVQLPAN